MLAATRERRANAGAKIAELVENEDAVDDFYQNQYGGFFDEEEDRGFDSPCESESDVIDSDFDVSEDDDDAASDNDDTDATKPKRRRVLTAAYKEPKFGEVKAIKEHRPKKRRDQPSTSHSADQLTDKKLRHSTLHKSSEAAERLQASLQHKRTASGHTRRKQRVFTQAQLLEEAVHTEKHNLESLKKYQEFELEQKRKRDRILKKRKVIDGPKIRYLSLTMTENTKPASNAVSDSSTNVDDRCCRNFVEFSDDSVFRKYFPKATGMKLIEDAKRTLGATCPITGLKAKYRDPVTKLAYANVDAFKRLRSVYEAYLLENAPRLAGAHPEIAQWYNAVRAADGAAKS